MLDPTKNEIIEWVRKNVDRYDRLRARYLRYAEVLAQILRQATTRFAPLAVVQARAKTLDSYAGKLIRKRQRYMPPKDPLIEMTDLCGARVITQTIHQVRAVGQFLEKHFSIDWENSDDVSRRLKATEFGYRSVHYIVSLEKNAFPTPDVDVELPGVLLDGIPAEMFEGLDIQFHPLKAEIQVRTVLEHAWADMSHELLYKRHFKAPEGIVREVAAIAARLEATDREFERIHDNLKEFEANYGGHLSEAQLQQELDTLSLMLEYEPRNVELAMRAANLAIGIGEWQRVIDLLEPFEDLNHQPVMRSLGTAICKLYSAQRTSEVFNRGRKLLEAAAAPFYNDPQALSCLAETWSAEDEDRAQDFYRQAFEIDSTHPHYLAKYVEFEVAYQRSAMILPLLAPTMKAACERCHKQIAAEVDVPWAYLNLAKFQLLMNQPFESLKSFCKAIQLSTTPLLLESALESLHRLRFIGQKIRGRDWAIILLRIGLVVKYKDEAALASLRESTTSEYAHLSSPIVIVAGGCDSTIETRLQSYRRLMIEAFKGFGGTVISGGTRQGICGVAGDVREFYGNQFRAVGYVPETLPVDATADKDPNRYDTLRITEGSGFSPLEPLQYWTDLLTAGIPASCVRLLGINGGRTAAIEYWIASVLGAQVALLETSGREAARFLADPQWRHARNVMRLPDDAMTIRAFLGYQKWKVSQYTLTSLAKQIHEAYRRNMQQKQQPEPSMADWEELPGSLRNSNLSQAAHIMTKLEEIGCVVVPAQTAKACDFEFTTDEVERLAEMEHGRWNVHRLKDGWQYGREKNVDQKTSPYLLTWEELPDVIKQYDRNAVLEIPALLAKTGLRICRKAFA